MASSAYSPFTAFTGAGLFLGKRFGGVPSEPSGALRVTFDYTPPGTAPVPDLDARDDSGASQTDNLTNVTQPVRFVTV